MFTFTQSNAVEAEEKLRYLLTYLEHQYNSSHVSHWFTQDACERAEEVIWDDETNRPISRAEMDLDELLEEDIDWLDDLDEAKLHFEAAKITVDRPKRFQKVQSNPLEGDAESLQTFYQGSDLPETDGENGVTSPTTGSSMFAGDFRESSATVVE